MSDSILAKTENNSCPCQSLRVLVGSEKPYPSCQFCGPHLCSDGHKVNSWSGGCYRNPQTFIYSDGSLSHRKYQYLNILRISIYSHPTQPYSWVFVGNPSECTNLLIASHTHSNISVPITIPILPCRS